MERVFVFISSTRHKIREDTVYTISKICECCRFIHYFEDKHCPTCHKTYAPFDKSFDYSEHIAQRGQTKVNTERQLHHFDCAPPRIRLLKALLGLVEVCIPLEALQPAWSDSYRKSWGLKLHMSSSAEDLLQVLTLLEGAIKEDFLSSNFLTTSELLASGNVVGYVVNDASTFGTVTVLPWIPRTSSAVALRLMELDSAISYLPDQKETEKDMEARHFVKLPSKYAVARNHIQEDELAGAYSVHQEEDAWVDCESKHLGFTSARGGRGRGGRRRNRGGRSQRWIGGSRGERSSRNLASNNRLGPVIGGCKARSSRGKGGRRRGRQSVRSNQKPVKKAAASAAGQSNQPEPVMLDNFPPGFSGRNEWKERGRVLVDVNDASDSERSEYEDDNGQASGDEYDMGIDDYNAGAHLMGGDYNVDGDEDNDDPDEVGDDDDEVGDDVDDDEVGHDVDDDVRAEYEQDLDIRGYLNADSEGEGNGDEDGERHEAGNEDGTSESSSSDYSSD